MYTVKFLDNESFNALPYKNVSTSLGVADRNAGVAYVRDTASPMDVFTAFHELEHLKGDDLDEHESPGEDGIYYKDTGGWMQTLAPIAAFIPGVGPAVSAGMAVGGGAMSQRSQAKQAQSMQNQQQQPTMDAFNPAASMANAAPATSSAGSTPGAAGGGLGAGTIDKVRQLMAQQQSGYYAGRNPGMQ